jgi:hypothetical protein
MLQLDIEELCQIVDFNFHKKNFERIPKTMRNQFFLAVFGTGTSCKGTTSTRLFLRQHKLKFSRFSLSHPRTQKSGFQLCKSHQVTWCGELVARSVIHHWDAPRPPVRASILFHTQCRPSHRYCPYTLRFVYIYCIRPYTFHRSLHIP